MKCLIIDDDIDFSHYLGQYVDNFLSSIFKKYEIKSTCDVII